MSWTNSPLTRTKRPKELAARAKKPIRRQKTIDRMGSGRYTTQDARRGSSAKVQLGNPGLGIPAMVAGVVGTGTQMYKKGAMQ